jgi:hypothetical protein
MSFDVKDIAPQYKEIMQHISQYPNAVVALETNKRMVVQVPDGAIASFLASELSAAGYHSEFKRGLKSSAYYVQAHYNYPY